MANTKSAQKNIRSSQKKRLHNLSWETKIKALVKELKVDVAKKSDNTTGYATKLVALQKAVDKAAKEKVIHKNKANRIKSIYAKKLSALLAPKGSKRTAK